jgi:hypothetical protein
MLRKTWRVLFSFARVPKTARTHLDRAGLNPVSSPGDSWMGALVDMKDAESVSCKAQGRHKPRWTSAEHTGLEINRIACGDSIPDDDDIVDFLWLRKSHV